MEAKRYTVIKTVPSSGIFCPPFRNSTGFQKNFRFDRPGGGACDGKGKWTVIRMASWIITWGENKGGGHISLSRMGGEGEAFYKGQWLEPSCIKSQS